MIFRFLFKAVGSKCKKKTNNVYFVPNFEIKNIAIMKYLLLDSVKAKSDTMFINLSYPWNSTNGRAKSESMEWDAHR